MKSTILGIETSCDESSAALIRFQSSADIEVVRVSTYSQVKLHEPYGGVVPEIASRNHLETINQMIRKATDSDFKQIDAIAVTNRPGLIGSLLVGVSAAKALAYVLNKPLIPVHHLEGHALSIFLNPETHSAIQYPALLAIISGGHTNLYVAQSPPEKWEEDFLKKSLIARSRDDAAGEAFDKTAKLMGFPYPGGIWIDQNAKKGDASTFQLPRALPQKSVLDFSFSGLKTATALLIEKLKKSNQFESNIPHLCASIQEAIVDALLNKIYLSIEKYKCKSLAIVGGVAANSRLRARLDQEWSDSGLQTPPLFPPLQYCTDNAAMIAVAGAFRLQQGRAIQMKKILNLNAIANPEV